MTLSGGKHLALALAGIILATGMSACGSADPDPGPGTAAIIGDTTISERQLTVATDELSDITAEQTPRSQALWVLAQGRWFLDIAQSEGLVTEANYDQVLDEMVASAGDPELVAADLSAPVQDFLVGIAAFQANQQQITEVAQLTGMDADFNPRYLRLSPEGQPTLAGPFGDVVELPAEPAIPEIVPGS